MQNRISDVLVLVAGALTLAVSRIWCDHQIIEYLLAPALRRQVWNAWISTQKVGGKEGENTRRHLYYGRSRELVKEAFGSVPPGMIAALGRLGSIGQPPSVYHALYTILSEGGIGAKWLLHTEKLGAETVLKLVTLPKSMRLSSLVRVCDMPDAKILGWLAHHLGVPKDELPQELLTKLKHATHLHEAQSILLKHYGHERLFPEAPVEVHSPLKPLDSPACIMRAAKQFENCLSNYIDQIYERTYYVYCYEGSELAIVGLRRLAPTDLWVIDQVCGKKNKMVSPETRKCISNGFARAQGIYSDWLSD